MSLAINTTTPEGIVLAADSRQSYRNRKGMVRIGSENASKLFQLNKRIGVAITGLAFLSENGEMKNISKFVEQFKREDVVGELDVKEVAEKLHHLFDGKYNWREQLDRLSEEVRNDLQQRGCEVLEIKKDQYVVRFRFKDQQGNPKDGARGVERIDLLIAGYNKDGSHEAYVCNIPGEVVPRRNSKEKGKEYGASWIGQIDVTSRVVLGWESRIFTIPFVQEAEKNLGRDQVTQQLQGLQYQISWGTMTLQDAIDFCSLAIKTTEAIQRFSDGIRMDPGDIPGVGGEIDIAVITPDKGLIWVSKKKLRVGENEIDLDKEPALHPE